MIRQVALALGIAFLFSVGPLAQSQSIPEFDQPINPDRYMIRPGDRLLITFVQSKLSSDTLVVNAEGKVVDQTLGVFDLSHISLSQARSILSKALVQLYNVPDIVISITEPRSAAINVSGAVRSPGLYFGYTSQRVSDIIAKAGGVLSDGSRRLIRFEGGSRTLNVDLDKAAYLGDLDSDPPLYAGFSVFVPNKSENLVQVVGEVNNPREIELLQTDSLSLLLKLAGGTRSHADIPNIMIINRTTNEHSDKLAAGDIVMVPPQKGTLEDNKVALFGAVKNPGFYSYTIGMTLSNLLQSAGGLLNDANPGLTTVFRRPRVDVTGRVTDLRFPISHVMGESGLDAKIALQPQDSIYVPVLVGYVRVGGAVFNPGFYPYVPGMSVKSYILGAGGYLPTANKNEILVFNPISKVNSVVSPEVVVHDGSQLTVQIREELR
jgi:protein involved in polysaccharide export with SLBB domain